VDRPTTTLIEGRASTVPGRPTALVVGGHLVTVGALPVPMQIVVQVPQREVPR